MKALVIGGTGTLGRGIVPALRRSGFTVSVYARGRTPNPFEAKSVELFHGDRFDREQFRKTVEGRQWDLVVDLCCFSEEDARSDLRVFPEVERFIFISSTAVFDGPLPEVPADETLSPDPSLDYGINKRAAETTFLEAQRRKDFPVTILRPSHVWGSGSPVGRQLGLGGGWIQRVLDGDPIAVIYGGQTICGHCHASDLGRALTTLLETEASVGEIFNVVGETLTWRQYHERVASALDRDLVQVDAPPVLFDEWPNPGGLPLRMARYHQYHSDQKLKRTCPDFEPRISLSDRIPKNVDWMRRRGLLEREEHDELEDRIIDTVRSLGLENRETTSWWNTWLPG